MKLIEKANSNWIPAKNMEDGQIAIIREWGTTDRYNGIIVQRCDNSLIQLGRTTSHGWSNLQELEDFCKVEILPSGSKLEI